MSRSTTDAKGRRMSPLHYVGDIHDGIRRIHAGRGFRYIFASGRTVRDARILERIHALVIPPAWTDVWICPDASGHIQAVGRDRRGRKQYRYHNAYRASRDKAKFDRMIAFGKALPKIRRAVARDVNRRGLPRRKVLATVVRLLETSLIRVGNDEYARDNGSFGLTTFRNRHATVKGAKIRFRFTGKSGIVHEVDLEDRRVARIVKSCQELPGQELFQYVDDDGAIHDVCSNDVNDYLHEIAGEDFTAKDFRTWAGTVLATLALKELEPFDSQAKAKRNLVAAIRRVADKLGNTPTVCRQSYIHPRLIESYLHGTLQKAMRRGRDFNRSRHFDKIEAEVFALLDGQFKSKREPVR